MATLLSFPDVQTPHEGHVHDPQAELRAVRAQAAVVRSLLDELDIVTDGSSGLAGAVAAQTVEELTQLAWRIVQAATAIAPHRVVPVAQPPARAAGEEAPQRIAG